MIEEMRVVAEIVSTAGSAARDAFFMYLAYKCSVVVIGFSVLTMALVFAYRIIGRAVCMASMANEIHMAYGYNQYHLITGLARRKILSRVRKDVQDNGTITAEED